MACSTAAQSKIRLIYAASWRASLLVDAAKILAASASGDSRAIMPPGLWRMLKPHFWMFMPSEGESTLINLKTFKNVNGNKAREGRQGRRRQGKNLLFIRVLIEFNSWTINTIDRVWNRCYRLACRFGSIDVRHFHLVYKLDLCTRVHLCVRRHRSNLLGTTTFAVYKII